MATVINNPNSDDAGSGVTAVFGIILLLFLIFLVLYYGLPFLTRVAPSQLSVPDRIDINVNQQPK